MKLKSAFAVFLLLLSSSAWSDTTFKWVFKAQDGKTKEPIDGLVVDFVMTDVRTKQKQSLPCTTNAQGFCEVSGTVAGGNFFKSARADAIFTISKEGYQKEFKTSTVQADSATKVVTILVDKSAAGAFQVTSPDGKPIEGTRIEFRRVGVQKQDMGCTTNAEGSCSIEFAGPVSDDGYVSKAGYYSERAKASGGRVVLTEASGAFQVTTSDGKAVEGTRIDFRRVGAQLQDVGCTTNADGSCSIEFPGRATDEGFVSKPGYDGERAKTAGGRVVLTATLDAAIAAAAADAKVVCTTKAQCDRAYALAQVYLNRFATTKIQFSNDTITETFNPTEPKDIGGRITRIPSSGGRWEVVLEAYCGGSKGPSENKMGAAARICDTETANAYMGYVAFVKSKLQ